MIDKLYMVPLTFSCNELPLSIWLLSRVFIFLWLKQIILQLTFSYIFHLVFSIQTQTEDCYETNSSDSSTWMFLFLYVWENNTIAPGLLGVRDTWRIFHSENALSYLSLSPYQVFFYMSLPLYGFKPYESKDLYILRSSTTPAHLLVMSSN